MDGGIFLITLTKIMHVATTSQRGLRFNRMGLANQSPLTSLQITETKYKTIFDMERGQLVNLHGVEGYYKL